MSNYPVQFNAEWPDESNDDEQELEVQFNAEWPGKRASDVLPGRWDDLIKGLRVMQIDKTVMRVRLKNKADADRARKAVQRHAVEQLKCYTHGWRVQSHVEQKTLYLRKVSLGTTTDSEAQRPMF